MSLLAVGNGAVAVVGEHPESKSASATKAMSNFLVLGIARV